MPSENSWVVITADCGKPPGSNVAVDVKPYCQFWHMGTVGASTPGINCFATVATAGREINADTCLNSGTVEEAYIFLMPSLCLGEIWATQTPASPALRAEEVSQLLLFPVLDLLWVLRSLRRWDNFCQGLLCSTACGMLVGYAHTCAMLQGLYPQLRARMCMYLCQNLPSQHNKWEFAQGNQNGATRYLWLQKTLHEVLKNVLLPQVQASSMSFCAILLWFEIFRSLESSGLCFH